METSQEGMRQIELEEGKRNRRYKDTAGNWTIGIGHLIRPEEDIPLIISDEEVYDLFDQDLSEVESAINDEVNVELTQEQFDALACFVFNIGKTRFRTSTVLRMANLRRWEDAGDALLLWDKERDPKDRQRLRVNPVLAARRRRERKLFLEGEYRNA